MIDLISLLLTEVKERLKLWQLRLELFVDPQIDLESRDGGVANSLVDVNLLKSLTQKPQLILVAVTEEGE